MIWRNAGAASAAGFDPRLQILLAVPPAQRPGLVRQWQDRCSAELVFALLDHAAAEDGRRGAEAALALAELACDVAARLDPWCYSAAQRREILAVARLHVGWWQSLTGAGDAARFLLRSVLAEHRRQPVTPATLCCLHVLLASVEAWAGASVSAWDHVQQARSAGLQATGGVPGELLEPLLTSCRVGELTLRLRGAGGVASTILESLPADLKGASPELCAASWNAVGWALLASKDPGQTRALLARIATRLPAALAGAPWLGWLEGRTQVHEGHAGAAATLAQAQRDLARAGAPYASALALLNRLAVEPQVGSLSLAASCAAVASALASLPAAAGACWRLSERIAAGPLSRSELALQARQVLAAERASGQLFPLYGPFWRL